mmetsp:Transcript_18158/g.35669  ORF Transcript_18158/g.35669 Transcript_18158/m.35669 type:complete len:209 (-) Transcript_18158:1297-1923(-)
MFKPFGHLYGHNLKVIKNGILRETALVFLSSVLRNLFTGLIILATPHNLLAQVRQVRLDRHVVSTKNTGADRSSVKRFEKREEPHFRCLTLRLYLEDNTAQTHQERVPVGRAVTLNVKNILVPSLLVHVYEIDARHAKLILTSEAHWFTEKFFITNVFLNKSSIKKRFARTVGVLKIPLAADFGEVDTLIVLWLSSSASGITAEEAGV